ncbi:MAG TPA: DUF4931 domain-containing protein [Pirellulales bacterium]|jgi:UDPglucose--hexose-1-phosphate uridylyltransferase|nr:DUF4931 domain-containing protein [Pirellulales bacterium]
MSDFRRNPITGQWVIIAENRAQRPQQVEVQQVVRADVACPFCEGCEHSTPSEVFALRAAGSQPNGPGWRVRVVPNKYPALEASASSAANLNREIIPPQSKPDEPIDRAAAAGRHEIIIESPRHLCSVAELNDAQFTEVVEVYHQRLATLRQSKQFRSAVIFKNGGPSAGATLAHVHSQLMAFENNSPQFGDRLSNFQSYYEQQGSCPVCDMSCEVSIDPRRLVAQTSNFVAYCPFASRHAYETWIVPLAHASHFDAQAVESLPELAALLRAVLVKLQRIVKLPAYNYILHTAPFDTVVNGHYHWHIEILPRTSNLAGFELGTGCYINAVLPEQAAAELRKAE